MASESIHPFSLPIHPFKYLFDHFFALCIFSVTPEVHSEPSPALETTPTNPTPPSSIILDPTQPVTSIQIRLGDGSRWVWSFYSFIGCILVSFRLQAKFNHSHTIGDIRKFIIEYPCVVRVNFKFEIRSFFKLDISFKYVQLATNCEPL